MADISVLLRFQLWWYFSFYDISVLVTSGFWCHFSFNDISFLLTFHFGNINFFWHLNFGDFYWQLFTVYCLLSTIYCLLSIVYCLLSIVYCLQSMVYCLLSNDQQHPGFTLIVCSSLEHFLTILTSLVKAYKLTTNQLNNTSNKAKATSFKLLE